MIIDFHTHIFPEPVAVKAISRLTSTGQLTPYTDGTIQGIRSSMEQAEIDLSIILPVATSPHQFDSVFKFAAQINESFSDCEGPRLFSFGGIHPDSSNIKEQLRMIKNEGMLGIKLHPHYQDVVFNDIRYKRIIDAASELGLIILAHAGHDAYLADIEYCTPDMIADILDELAPPALVLAHMGSNLFFDETMEKLCGRNVFFDTSYSFMHMSEDTFTKIILKHGVERILFGTDSPWTPQKDFVHKFRNLPTLTENEKNLIFSHNAVNLLKRAASNQICR